MSSGWLAHSKYLWHDMIWCGMGKSEMGRMLNYEWVLNVRLKFGTSLGDMLTDAGLGWEMNCGAHKKKYILPPLRRFSSSSSSSRSWAAVVLAGAEAAACCGGTDSDKRLNAASTLLGRNRLHSLITLCRPSTPMRLNSASNRACDASRIYNDKTEVTDKTFYFTTGACIRTTLNKNALYKSTI